MKITLGAERSPRGLRMRHFMKALLALADRIVIYLLAQRVFIAMQARQVVEALFVELFGWKHWNWNLQSVKLVCGTLTFRTAFSRAFVREREVLGFSLRNERHTWPTYFDRVILLALALACDRIAEDVMQTLVASELADSSDDCAAT